MQEKSLKILIMRNFAQEIDIESYNVQELGIARALIKKGHECDIVLYTSRKNRYTQEIPVGDKKINIYWTPAKKIMSNAIYINLIKEKFFEKYDIIQTSEYHQIMTAILPIFTKKPIVLFHGIYKDNDKKYINKIYDTIFLKSVIKNMKATISKSKLTTEYLKSKKISNISTLGIGLDLTNLTEEDLERDNSIEDIKMKVLNKKVLLYVGRLDDNKNIKFMIDILKNIVSIKPDIRLLLIGKGDNLDVKKYFEYAEEQEVLNNIIHVNGLNQNQLKSVYKMSDIFLLPSKYEIFGMVLLESMYFKIPVISSLNGGSSTIIDDGHNGFIISEFNTELWSKKILSIIDDNEYLKKLGNNAHQTIADNFIWDKLIEKYIDVYKSSLN